MKVQFYFKFIHSELKKGINFHWFRTKLVHFHTFYFFLSCPIYLKSCKSAKKSFISSLAHKTKTSQDTIDNRDVERLRQLFREVETSKYHVHNVV